VLCEDAAAVGRCIADLELDELGAEVTTIRRGSERIEARSEIELMAGDVVVLRGSGDAVTRAESRLL